MYVLCFDKHDLQNPILSTYLFTRSIYVYVVIAFVNMNIDPMLLTLTVIGSLTLV